MGRRKGFQDAGGYLPGVGQPEGGGARDLSDGLRSQCGTNPEIEH
ncbi:hypothetical protein EO087_06185 [Dyella sp. M7H15-1]|nr:hypothetical protein EO087_06185 [Dyella sp. M7H15-1]